MKNVIPAANNNVWMLPIIGLTLVALSAPVPTLAARRVVLGEYFNATW